MKQSELRAIGPCVICGMGIAHGGNFLFWRVELSRYGLLHNRIRQQAALETMLGSPALAAIMGPDEDLAQQMMATKVFTVCEPCALNKSFPISVIAEVAGYREDQRTPST